MVEVVNVMLEEVVVDVADETALVVVVVFQSVKRCALPAGDAGGLSFPSIDSKFKDNFDEFGDLGDGVGCNIFASGLDSSTAANHAVVGDGCLRLNLVCRRNFLMMTVIPMSAPFLPCHGDASILPPNAVDEVVEEFSTISLVLDDGCDDGGGLPERCLSCFN